MWKKVAIGAGAGVVALIVGVSALHQATKDIVTVQTAKARRQDLASMVSASGEIRPRNYVNIGANAFGRITHLYVREGERVRKGQQLAQIENVQPSADVEATKASLEAAITDAAAAEAALNTAKADLNRARSDSERGELDWTRAQGLYKEALISKADYDSRKAAWETAQAGLAQAQARVAQAQAQRESAERHVAEVRATLTRAADVLQKTEYVAPYDGVITNLPVREGETAVVGIQNAPGSTLMTLADMSVITAEVMADETDIVNVQLGQPAEVTIDAIPGKSYHAVVTEIGNNAIVRSTGVATTQTTTAASQEAKDFKVVVTLENPPQELRPGLSATAKITTATRANALTIPTQALTVRASNQLSSAGSGSGGVEAAGPQNDAANGKKLEDVQGVFVIRDKRAEFVPVETGISGTTEIEVLKGLKAGDEVVTGSYKVLRTMRSGTRAKVDNSTTKQDEGGS